MNTGDGQQSCDCRTVCRALGDLPLEHGQILAQTIKLMQMPHYGGYLVRATAVSYGSSGYPPGAATMLTAASQTGDALHNSLNRPVPMHHPLVDGGMAVAYRAAISAEDRTIQFGRSSEKLDTAITQLELALADLESKPRPSRRMQLRQSLKMPGC